MNKIYPEIIYKCIKKLSYSFYDYMKSVYEDSSELPSIDECKDAVEATFSEIILDEYSRNNLNDDEDIDALIYSIFNVQTNYNLILKFSTRAIIIHAKNSLDARN